jgi:hypothetical protein
MICGAAISSLRILFWNYLFLLDACKYPFNIKALQGNLESTGIMYVVSNWLNVSISHWVARKPKTILVGLYPRIIFSTLTPSN